MSFEDYRGRMKAIVLDEVAKFLRAAPLRELEDVALRLAHVMENRDIDIPATPEGAAFALLAAKTITEVSGFAACCYAGSLWASHHHVRAMMELYGTTVHLICKPESQQKRLARFHEYSDFCRYQQHLLSATPRGSTDLEITATTDLAYLEAKVPIWTELYQQTDLLKVREWHRPATIDTLLEDCDTLEDLLEARNGKEPTKTHQWRRLYAVTCHGTHVSPVGHRMAGTGGLPLFAMPKDIVKVYGQVHLIGGMLVRLVALWDAVYIASCRLGRRMRYVLATYSEAAERMKPAAFALARSRSAEELAELIRAARRSRP